MKVTQAGEHGMAIDVVCDVCGMSTRDGEGQFQYGTMHASWGQGSSHCGEEYELHLCENCFFVQVSTMQRTRWIGVMFEEGSDAILYNDAYGRLPRNDETG
ncbi:hypothetical protein QQ994_22015 [Pseudomonas asiatica]|uniref:hypothetical protein n=1 Tax=Pseudomonas asiatica TaxID=2219225 RepID=UPI002570C0A6|nr:hypothetical protein [Pseudomonas asiatica]WJD69257.1 hypothetical protein QQ994_22015 [Pseudomonas asiatica]